MRVNRMPTFFVALFGVVSLGCTESTTSVTARCEIEIEQPSEIWERGSTVTVHATPLTSVVDTRASINDTALDVLSVDTSSCTDCEACKEEAFCTTCDFCDTCVNECLDCQHTLTVQIPIGLPTAEEYWLTLYNGLGSSAPVVVSVENPTESDATDSEDSGSSD